jgi:uncharacterized protein (AIM24 family)
VTNISGEQGFLEPYHQKKSSPSRVEVIDCVSGDNFKVEILGYKSLSGINDPETAQAIYYANQVGMQLKQIKITLQSGEAQIEAGALQYLYGQIQVENKAVGMAGLGKAMLNKLMTNESLFIPRYRGSGCIFLEPSFSHFLVYYLNNEELICDRGLFYCGEGSLEVGAAMQRNVSSALFGGEGLFQTRIRGTGICVFELPVPASEVHCVHLNNETLKVDGNFALMRSGKIEFSVEKSTKTIFGTLTSGEGLLQTFRGIGRVWLAPTQGVYEQIRVSGVDSLSHAPKLSNNFNSQ